MPTASHAIGRLDLRSGEWVEVRSKEEILATLDGEGRLDGLTFMPEMFAFCGARLRVGARADKTCDTVSSSGLRRMSDTVHLEGVRCDGTSHGGCQAGCYVFWKEGWLRRPDSPSGTGAMSVPSPRCDESRVIALTMQPASAEDAEVRYRCQATLLLEATAPLSKWDLRQYVRDVRGRNFGPGRVIKLIFYTLFRYTLTLRGYRLQLATFNWFQRARGGHPMTHLTGSRERTPAITLGLQPGEKVRVKNVEAVVETLDVEQKTRGLYFDMEMTPFCGHEARVLRRVSRIIDEKTGRMINIPNACIVLENVVCRGHYHQGCPRAIPPYWREAWLERVES
jgi:hypothetical protein